MSVAEIPRDQLADVDNLYSWDDWIHERNGWMGASHAQKKSVLLLGEVLPEYHDIVKGLGWVMLSKSAEIIDVKSEAA